jgi:regulator of protease activity HflC (stomatin/prohibitin superfamily)
MASALRSVRRPRGGEGELDRLLADARRYSGEFPLFLANHLPMVLVAMQRLGGSDARLAEFFARYRDANGLVAAPPPVERITRERWTEALGDRARGEGQAEIVLARPTIAPSSTAKSRGAARAPPSRPICRGCCRASRRARPTA